MNIANIRPRNDNVLVQLDVHASRHEPEQLSPGGIILPRFRDASSEDAVVAIVIAAGPGAYADAWLDHERGTAAVGSRVFVPVDEAIKAGARVILSKAALAADRVWSDDYHEYRMVRVACIEAVVE